MSLTPDDSARPDAIPTMPAPLAPTRKLVHGAEMPVLGLGTSPVQGEAVVRQVAEAVAAGYRLIDTAENYGNEAGVGEGLRASGVDRSEIFLTSKLNRRWHSVDGVRQACEASLERLGTDYLDLFLVHWPNPDQGTYVDAVRGLEALREEGLLHAIGVSNFKPAHLQRVVDETGIFLDVNQVQLSPYTTRPDVRAANDVYGTATESWSPIGASSAELREDEVLARVGRRYDKTPTQVILRWHVQLGLVPIPKSTDPAHLAENIAVFDFELAPDDLEAIAGLDRGDEGLTDSDTFGH
ncbi:aldo/keto reductase [Microlunatus flavus]|uniref:2,5-diketo-D-gluconate reductase A n=1 Tax=Microlunatus flavus TaxID=1036181 RepID=A0A1H8Z857_9ACTN|nr:aldo/keto reductase [Microlunatus flavus]SEP60576.1 2,5-diketo-D-gluconate reductase A [Microlunatus flavus]